MKRLKRLLRRVRVKFVRSSRGTKTAVIFMIAASMVTLLTLSLSIEAFEKRLEEYRTQAAQEEHKKNELKENIENLGSAEGIEDIAQGELGMVPTDAVVIKPTTPQQ